MITLATADALDALGLAIFNPQITPAPAGSGLGNHWGKGVGLPGQDDATDAQLYSLLADVIKTIDGRDMVRGLKLTLNYTNATQCRPYHWMLQTQELDGSGYGWPASAAFEYHPQPGYTGTGSANSFGAQMGLAVCAASCHAWAWIIRTWLAGNYPLAVNQPTQLIPTGWAAAPLQVGGYLVRAGTIFKITAQSGVMWQAQFYADTSGNFPVNDTYETTLLGWFNMEDGILGVKPAVVS